MANPLMIDPNISSNSPERRQGTNMKMVENLIDEGGVGEKNLL